MATSKIKSYIEGTWQNVPSQPDPSVTALKYMIRNGVCYVNMYDNGNFNLTQGSWVTMGILPENARPSTTVYGSFFNRTGNGGEWAVQGNGEVKVNSSYTGRMFISTSLAVPIA